MIKQLFILLALVLGIGISAHAQDIPEPMTPRRIVNDFTGLFNKQELAALEDKLVNFNNTSSTQIAVVTVPTLDGYDINDYAARLGEKWGIGQKGKDNGIVILIKPKSGREKGEVAISVGYGLEGVVPDITAARVIRKEIIPAFQQGKFYGGIDKATSVLIDLSKGEYTADEYKKKSEGGFSIVIGVILILVIISLIFRRRGDNGYTPGHSASGGFFFFPMGGGGSSGGFGGFSSGGGSFGGFGGGGFGGGGSSGSW